MQLAVLLLSLSLQGGLGQIDLPFGTGGVGAGLGASGQNSVPFNLPTGPATSSVRANEQGSGAIFSGFDARGPGQQASLAATLRFTDPNFDWYSYDRRDDEKWYHLYGFGERYHDMDISYRPWMDKQIDLDFFFPFFGFRFNYTFIFPEGFIAFSYPRYIQPPYTFPNTDWPRTPDPSFIASFMTDQTLMAIGEHRISHIWFRTIYRPPNLIGLDSLPAGVRHEGPRPVEPRFGIDGVYTGRTYRGQLLRTQEGRLEDPEFLDMLSRDIREGMVGARGFIADYALVVTWERMAYGGAPRVTQLNMYGQVRRWQNTYQMVIATDEVRSYVMFNYANINWTSSTSAGALFGRGGKQSALVGFNGGNGTGFVELPYSAEGNSYKLVQFGATPTAGRWLARVDEEIIYGGCTNTTIGKLQVHPPWIDMLGGVPVNVSGPCLRPNDNIKLQIDILTIDCVRINMAIARCVLPVYSLYIQGATQIKVSIDGGKTYPFWSTVYIVPASRGMQNLRLIDNPVLTQNSWRNPYADKLMLRWDHVNVTTDFNRRVDLYLYGYWEDTMGHSFRMIGAIGEGLTNNGEYEFQPAQLWNKDQEIRNQDRHLMYDGWRQYQGGAIMLRVSGDEWREDHGDQVYWSSLIPFGWYYLEKWRYEYGTHNWALQMCIDWFEYDGRRQNFVMELEPQSSCPCRLEQALADFGRFAPYEGCDKDGNSFCYYHQGASHCVLSTKAVWTGSGQVCCYGVEGFLMFAEDYEYGDQYLRFYSAGTSWRAHPWGSPPYRRPPYVPSLSNFYNDLMPFDFCCKWAEKCEFYFWRRPSSGCQAYRPPALGYGYGLGHFITFDGTEYMFPGNGYFVLAMLKSPKHDMMIQIRMEQPPKTFWDSEVPATVITGIAAQDNSSSLVEVIARKNHRRWRYRTDVWVNNEPYWFDTPHQKTLNFEGVSLRVPARTTDMGIIEIMFDTGVGIRVQEFKGALAVTVSLPPNYNVSLPWDYLSPEAKRWQQRPEAEVTDCKRTYMTMGLMGTFNNRKDDDLMTPECQQTRISERPSENELQGLYRNFGERWRADGVRYKILFNTDRMPLYNPTRFLDLSTYRPQFTVRPELESNFYRGLVFTFEQVQTTCQGVPACIFDFWETGIREIGLQTLTYEQEFNRAKLTAEQEYISCGPLQKGLGVLKYPQFDNYLDGRTVTFDCQPDYFLHGEKQRTCVNGTWTPGWWVWCRTRNFEYFLKWLVGLGTAFLVILIIIIIFLGCYWKRVKEQKNTAYRPFPVDRAPQAFQPTTETKIGPPTSMPMVHAMHGGSGVPSNLQSSHNTTPQQLSVHNLPVVEPAQQYSQTPI